MQEPILLTHNLNEARESAIRGLAEPLGIAVRPVPAAGQHTTLGTLLAEGVAADGAAAQAAEASFDEEMIIMCHFPRPLLNALLDGFRDKGIPSVSLMAVLTPTNATWTSAALYRELCKERAYFLSRQAEQDKDEA